MIDGLTWNNWFWSYYRFDTRMSGLMIGSLLAVIPWRPGATAASSIGLYSLGILILALVLFRIGTMASLIWGGLIADIASAGLILSLTTAHLTPLARALSHPVLRYIGMISYSIYLWHYPLARALRDDLNPLVALAIVLAFAISAAAICYQLLEKPLKIYRHREAPV